MTREDFLFSFLIGFVFGMEFVCILLVIR